MLCFLFIYLFICLWRLLGVFLSGLFVCFFYFFFNNVQVKGWSYLLSVMYDSEGAERLGPIFLSSEENTISSHN